MRPDSGPLVIIDVFVPTSGVREKIASAASQNVAVPHDAVVIGQRFIAGRFGRLRLEPGREISHMVLSLGSLLSP